MQYEYLYIGAELAARRRAETSRIRPPRWPERKSRPHIRQSRTVGT
jgi:hypothetical protein